MAVLLAARRDGTKVRIKMPTTLEKHYAFELDFSSETIAELVATDMDRRIDEAVQLARREAYNDGWREAKSKKVAKRDWFSRALSI